MKKKLAKNHQPGALHVTLANQNVLLGAMTDVVLVLNSEGRYLEIAPTNPNLLYKPADHLIGRTLHEVFSQPHAAEMLGYIRRALKTGDTVHSEYRLTIEGKDVWFNAAISPLTNDSVVWVARDITERKIAEETSREQTAQMEEVLKASLSLTANLELSDLLARILESALRLARDAQDAHLFLYDSKRDVLSFGAGMPLEHFRTRPYSPPRENGLTYTVARRGEMIVVPNMNTDPLFVGLSWHGAIIGLPLKIGQDVVGVMNVAYSTPHEFSTSELSALRLLGDQAAVAIQNSRLFISERAARVQAEALIEVAHTFTTSLELGSLLQLILEQLARVVDYDSSSIMLLVGDTLDIVAAHGFDLYSAQATNLSLDNLAHIREVISERRPVVIADTSSDPRWLNRQTATYIRCWLGLPLVVKDRVIGVLNLDKQQVGFYNDFDPGLALTFASQAAVAIENARLFESISRNAQEMWRASDVLRSLNTVPDVIGSFGEIAEGLKMLSGCEHVSLMLLDDNREKFTVVAVDRSRAGLEAMTPFLTTTTAAQGDLLSGRVHVTLDLSTETEYPVEAALLENGFRSRVSLPLHVGDQIIGALSFLWRRTFGFDNINVNLLAQTGDAVALAIEKSRLLDETRHGDFILQALAQVSHQLLMPGDLDETLPEVIAHLGRATDTTFAYFFENHDDGGDLYCTMRYLWSARTNKVRARNKMFQKVSYKQMGIERWAALLKAGSPVYGLPRDFPPKERLGLIKQNALSFALVPIFVGDDWWGVLGFTDHWRERRWLMAEIEALKSVAGALGAAFSRQKIEAAERQHRALTEALRDSAAALNSTLNLDEVLDLILDVIGRVLPHDAASIMMLDEVTDTIYVARAAGYARRGLKELVDHLRLSLDSMPSLRKMGATLKPVVVPDPNNIEGWVVFPELAWVRSYLGAPIHSRGEVIGFLNLDSATPGLFTFADADRLQVFADQAAVAIENARLYKATQQNASELASLYHASSELLNPGSDLKSLGARVAAIVTEELNQAHCAVLLLNEASRELRVIAHGGDEHFYPPKPVSLDGIGLLAVAARNGEVVYSPNVAIDPRYLRGNDVTQSELCVPLIFGGRVIGVLDVASQHLDAFDERVRRVIIAFSEQVAIAMENVNLLSRLELARETAEEANQVKGQFLANTSHELRTPLTGIIGSLSMVVDGLCDTREEEHECVHIAYNASQRLLTIINNVLDVAKIESGRMDVSMQEVDIAPILADVYALIRVQADEKRITLTVNLPAGSLPPAWADPDMLRQVLLNLVGNAIKFTHQGGVTVQARVENSKMEIAVIDTGIGIPLHQQPKLFQPFVQADGSMTRKYGGTGLGLSISRKLAEIMGGSVAMYSEGEGKGSTFTLTVLLASSVKHA
ncbi:MAG: GAF domain-containing protein [Chloroflexi bacterium]|nr:GAF domain-containing protein [Chloroflexota bacterium]